MATTNHNVPAMWTNKPSIHKDSTNPDDSSSSDDEPQVRMRVGEMYQAKVPQWDEVKNSTKTHSKEGMLIWSPTDTLSEEKLDSYCQVAKVKHSYNIEQALGMLFWHKHDVTKSLNDMQNFTPMPDEWSMEDKVLFEQAYTFHGKNFRKIQQLIPDKDICQLVKHYYTWKKNRTKTSLMDRQAAKRRRESDDSQGDEEENSLLIVTEVPPLKQHVPDNDIEVKHKLPKGIQLSLEDIKVFANDSKGPEGHLEVLDNQLVELKRQIQCTKQDCGRLTSKITGIVQPPTAETPNEIWTNEETKLVLQGLKHLGKDFASIADIVETKTKAQVEAMVEERREELNIDAILMKNKEIKMED